ncbi:S41 family peptidase [Sediminibacterium ginsengisoli]|uniref:Tricorn protease homolog n=1 Tax=Sediminibacterium ginsengisoli TaxID=413434 RepID=A0A1T4JYB5_9BACT|nr:S41 family peptidase [Sediminibacterium ginsengisoli]SJZ35170.1 N-terminal domain of tricorn protease-containing protein [Sediminibacterium ginsengisoli]
MSRILMMLTACCLSAAVTAQQPGTYFLSSPALTPDGETVVFSFEGDLWKAGVKDGQATRLTAMQGYESNARISPDGKWIAFTGRQYGNPDVFIMPLAGGEIRQLTFHSASDDMNSWSWDSRSIYFTSNRAGQQAGYTVGINGGTPKRVFGDHFFQYDHALTEHPLTGEIFFNDTWESSNQATRKKYRGPFNPDIQSYNPKTKQYKKYTDWDGKDFGATIDRNGNLYFISDEANGEYNLYTMDKGKKTALTNFPASIRTPVVNANGGYVVFEKEYRLWLYDVASRKSRLLDINVLRNNVLPSEKDYDVRNSMTNFDVSPDGKKLVFTARGELFVSDVDGKFVKQLNKGNTERAREVKWMSDNRTIVFNQTSGGFLNWYTITADGSAPVKQLTSDLRNNRAIALNKARTKGVYLSGRDEVRLLDLKTGESKTLAKDEIWGFQNSDPGFSPNDEYVVFTAIRNFEQDIFVHHIKDNKTINLTKTGVTEASPVWSPDSRYIYFISARTKPSYPFGMQNPRIYRMPLEKIDEPYRSDKYEDMFKQEKKDTTRKDTTKKAPPVVASINIDTDKIMERLEQVGPSFGSQYLLTVVQKGEKTVVLFVSDHAEGRSALWKTTYEPFEQPKTEKINGTDGMGADFAEGGDKTMLLMNGNIYKLNIDLSRTDPVVISNVFRRNLAGEFTQIYEEAWAQLDENYYDEKFHGADWPALKKKYGAFLPYLNNRGDLRILLADLLGELNSSHLGFTSNGSEESVILSNRTMETGIVFDNNDPYKVSYIAKRSNADKKSIDVKPGDILVKVNDEAVNREMDRNYYFSKPSIDKEMRLTFSRNGAEYQVKIHPQVTLGSNLYDEWIDNNQKRVDEKSNNRIAYHHMKNMSTDELEKFLLDMTQDLYSKDALILDLRYNTGGNVHDEVLKFLSQRSYLKWKYREGKLANQSNFGPSDKPIVLLINEQSLSDAEMTAQGFKSLKLGSIIGTGTYRWIIFTSGAGLVDGSFVRLPGWGCYTLDGNDLEKTGVEPDIKVPMGFEDRLNKKDPQLDRAITEIMKQLK